mmetsp:Transcript_15264/g.32963  ORF Transcript_15264/g.32963 Transcript_15264/m.32963 type:complete len:395 (+) Transcript_15264:186-1370(+)|eukprot:CAMPEP_0194761700 /NCGR_PEP_ID=MMETSP0323_2-20130528/14367_1 /TAXON_ID=2866 ORGANISM="Crypthecodinium cohnii, Strain Seligo" /NCGR_SAMPLE_ID=MMETSP0323_2 /ASSEMBLY_ACC=CAM_ASM_000346 /LENGTH=394 /DNA_ID=CAMNT_0039683563 /DNA_START=109 /DNA_END=1293 /DNA_ORIENTATION=+
MADIVDLEEIEESPVAPAQPSPEELKSALEAHLTGRDLSALSLKGLRRELEQRLGFLEGGLDSRKDEIKGLAQAFAQARAVAEAAAAASPAAAPHLSPQKTEAPPAKRRKGAVLMPLCSAADGDKSGAGCVDAPETKPATAAKKKNAPSAYSLWATDNRPRIMQELAAQSGSKPSFAEMAKAVSEGWKNAGAEDKTVYEKKASEAKAALAAEGGQAKPVSGKGKGKGRGGGGGAGAGAGTKASKAAKAAKVAAGNAAMTRAEFLRDAQALKAQVGQPLADKEEELNPLCHLSGEPRLFKSGSVGWFMNKEFEISIGGKTIKAKAQLNIMVPASKHWQDGEGLPQPIEAGGTEVAEAENETHAPDEGESAACAVADGDAPEQAAPDDAAVAAAGA